MGNLCNVEFVSNTPGDAFWAVSVVLQLEAVVGVLGVCIWELAADCEVEEEGVNSFELFNAVFEDNGLSCKYRKYNEHMKLVWKYAEIYVRM